MFDGHSRRRRRDRKKPAAARDCTRLLSSDKCVHHLRDAFIHHPRLHLRFLGSIVAARIVSFASMRVGSARCGCAARSFRARLLCGEAPPRAALSLVSLSVRAVRSLLCVCRCCSRTVAPRADRGAATNDEDHAAGLAGCVHAPCSPVPPNDARAHNTHRSDTTIQRQGVTMARVWPHCASQPRTQRQPTVGVVADRESSATREPATASRDHGTTGTARARQHSDKQPRASASSLCSAGVADARSGSPWLLLSLCVFSPPQPVHPERPSVVGFPRS